MKEIKHGIYPTMITPYNADGSVDYGAVDAIVDWYIQNGVDGIFAVCQSSEMFYLDEQERANIARRVVDRAHGRVSVVASGHVSYDAEAQARELKRIRDSGVDAVVLVSNRLAAQHEDDDVLIKRLDVIAAKLDGVPLGMYECPHPYKRLLSMRVLEHMACSGRFAFIKDTCCDAQLIRQRVAQLGQRVALYNANSATLLDSLRAGCAGFSGIMANFHPALYGYLYKNWRTQDARIETLSAFLSLASGIERGLYPTSAKYHMNCVGVHMNLYCRSQPASSFTPLLKREVDDLITLERVAMRDCGLL